MSKWSNQARRARNDYPARSGRGPLSNEQKAALCILAREAFERVSDFDAAANALGFAEWRHEQQHAACGKASLRDCAQADYQTVRAHFLALKGETGQALNAHLAGATEDRRLALHKLGEALRAAGKPDVYAAAICRRRFKCGLEEASPRQLWQLIFTIHNRQ